MKKNQSFSPHPVFNYAIWLYDMNMDDIFDHDRHVIIDSSLGVIEEEGDVNPEGLDAPDYH